MKNKNRNCFLNLFAIQLLSGRLTFSTKWLVVKEVKKLKLSRKEYHKISI